MESKDLQSTDNMSQVAVAESYSDVSNESQIDVMIESEPSLTNTTNEGESSQDVNEMVADIEEQEQNSSENEELENIIDDNQQYESLEEIEKEYESFSYEDTINTIENVVKNIDYTKIKQRVGVLRAKLMKFLKEDNQERLQKFLAEGGRKEDYEYTVTGNEERINKALHLFKENKNRYLELQELQKQKNLEQKKAIIEELKKLVETETNLKILNDKFRQCQDQWKEIGAVPQSEVGNLWQNYHFYVEKFFDILRINKEFRTLDLKKNLEQKILICERAESLLIQDSISHSFKELQLLHEEWKEVGPVPDDKKEEIWERFKSITAKINNNRREYYDKMFGEQQNNYNAKVVICEQVEELLREDINSIQKYNEISDKLSEILKFWKAIGSAPAKLNDEIWTRFKTSIDVFFENKKNYFSNLKQIQNANYDLKVKLTERVEAIATRTDWRQATDELLTIQNEWKEIGTVPRKYSVAIWNRFRVACDVFFAAKSEYFKNLRSEESNNLEKKKELLQKIANHQFGNNKQENLDALKTFQREWTDIGYVPKKDKDKISAEYKNILDKKFADLKITTEEFKQNNYSNRLDTILNNPNAEKIIDKEKKFLINKMNQLKDDISLWENNLGFFAHSKNADILKIEFLKKIDSAKEELKSMELKLKTMSAKQKV